MRITSKPLGLVILLILFGGIFITSAMNIWTTESTKIPVKFTEGEASGAYNPADIRGSYTLGEVSKLFDIPLEILGTAFGVPQDENLASYSLKNFETLYANYAAAGTEIGTSSVRLFVAFYTGLPFELVDDIYVPRAAAEILIANGGLTDERKQYLEGHAVNLKTVQDEMLLQPVTVTDSITASADSGTETHTEYERVIKGKTTFGEVLTWGVSEEAVKAVIGSDLPEGFTLIKDYCTERGLSFETIKPALQAEVDKLK